MDIDCISRTLSYWSAWDNWYSNTGEVINVTTSTEISWSRHRGVGHLLILMCRKSYHRISIIERFPQYLRTQLAWYETFHVVVVWLVFLTRNHYVADASPLRYVVIWGICSPNHSGYLTERVTEEDAARTTSEWPWLFPGSCLLLGLIWTNQSSRVNDVCWYWQTRTHVPAIFCPVQY
jgi:hypothetical protein